MPDDNAAALWMLLYTIYGQLRKAPEKASVTALTHVATPVDKYELHEGSGCYKCVGQQSGKGRT